MGLSTFENKNKMVNCEKVCIFLNNLSLLKIMGIDIAYLLYYTFTMQWVLKMQWRLLAISEVVEIINIIKTKNIQQLNLYA